MNVRLFNQIDRLLMHTDTLTGSRLRLRLAVLNLIKAIDKDIGKPYIEPLVAKLSKLINHG